MENFYEMRKENNYKYENNILKQMTESTFLILFKKWNLFDVKKKF